MLKHSLIIVLLAFTAGFAAPGRAGDPLLPEIPAAQARFSATQGCVEPTEDMRKNHMKYILHKRDETMHEGIRTSRHSLKACINCHVSDAPDAPHVSSREHFCNSCHSYAAVHIDCFQCHNDHPVKTGEQQTVSAGGGERHAMTGGAYGRPHTDGTPILAREGIAHE
jgi:hypothetical protein